MPSTTNFGWTTPADTDLVKDGAAAIRTLGNGVDSSFVDLKGGTSGQILAKNSNTDLDFVWVANDQGDITAVTAGTGISGGGTSGAVTITNSMATEITAKGDLIVGTGSGTFDNLPAGTNGYTLVADSSVSPTGLKWAAPATGAVVAVKAAYKSNTFSMASATFSDITDLSITYTPTSASNKILLIATISATGQNGTSGFNFRFLRGATAIGVGDASGGLTQATISSQAQDDNNPAAVAMSYLDSPATTSSTTWKVQMRMAAGTGYVNRSTSDTLARNSSNLILMEVTP